MSYTTAASLTPNSLSTIKALQWLGIMSAAVKAGHSFGESFCTIPLLLRTTSSNPNNPTTTKSNRALLLTQWHAVYASGLAFALSTVTPAFLSFCTLTYLTYKHLPHNSAISKANAVAAVLVFGMVPVTLLPILKINLRLIAEGRKVGEAGEGKGEMGETKEVEMGEAEVRELVGDWAWWNAVRGGLMVSVGGLGLWTALGGFGV